LRRRGPRGLRPKLAELTRILVVEDFKPYRDVIGTLLAGQKHVRVVGEIADGLKAIEEAPKLNPDVILLDIGLPSLNGIEVARQVSKLLPRSRIIFLTQESSGDVAQEALRAGGIGYVLKSRAANDLPAAIEAALRGDRFVSSGLTGDEPAQETAETSR